MKKLYIKADFNDADHGCCLVTISDGTFERLLPVMKAINNFEPYVARHSYGGVDYSNWKSHREDLGQLPLEEKYPGIDKSLLDEFAELLVRPIPVPEEGCKEWGPHTIVSIVDVVTDEVYVSTEGLYSRHSDKVKGYLEENARLYSYKRKSDGKSLNCIPFVEMTEEENKLIEEVRSLWKKYI